MRKKFSFFAVLIVLQNCLIPKNLEFNYPLVKQRIVGKPANLFQLPTVSEQVPDLNLAPDNETLPHFEILKIFPQNIHRRVYEISISQDGKYATFINRWNLTKLSLETFKEVKILNHRQLVQGGFTGIGVSEDGEKIVAGTSWTHKATLYNWKGESFSNFYCESNSYFVYDAIINTTEDQVLLLCYDFANNKKEVRSFDEKGNLNWKREGKSLHLIQLSNNKFVNYEDKNFSIWSKVGKQENFFIFDSKIVSIDYASKLQIFLFGNSKEWGLFRIGERKEALINVKIEKDIFSNEEYSLNEEFKSFYKFFNSEKFILTGGSNGGMIWSFKGELIQHLKGHLRNVSAIAINPTDNLIITASPDRWIIWKRIN